MPTETVPTDPVPTEPVPTEPTGGATQRTASSTPAPTAGPTTTIELGEPVETVPQGSTSTVVQSGAQPSTGSNVAPLVIGAAVVLALGGLAFVISRRREWEE